MGEIYWEFGKSAALPAPFSPPKTVPAGNLLLCRRFPIDPAIFSYFYRKIAVLPTIKIINRSPHPLPAYETAGSAGLDLRANLEAPLELPPLGRALVPTGLFLEIPAGWEGQVRPRSGLALKAGLTLLNTPGTIDSDYRGELKCIMVNLSDQPQTIHPGDRIAQLVLARYERVDWQEVDLLEASDRGEGGFGSTGR
jgi:dUTP pyrophosphatase